MKWTKEPPTEPAFYWWRSDTDTPRPIEILSLDEQFGGKNKIFGLYVRGVSRNMYSLSDWDGGEWWPEKIEPPEDSE